MFGRRFLPPLRFDGCAPMRILAVLAVLVLLAPMASAEVFVLADGGRLTGELLNPKETPRKQYVIRTGDGAKVTLAADQVRKVLPSKPAEEEYERIAPTYADTAAAQWELAEWCREHKLTAQRRVHLQRVIEIEPNHVAARHALGYGRVNGAWATQKEVMTAQGFVRSGGKWLTPEEIAIAEKKRKSEAAQQEWCQKLKRWRGWLGTKHDQEGRDNIAAIKDPTAVKGLRLGLTEDRDAETRLLFAAALGRIDTPDAVRALAVASVCDSNEAVRMNCLDQLQDLGRIKSRPEAVAYYVSKLSPKKSTNDVVNLAAAGRGRLKDSSAVPSLIDAVVTRHRFKVKKPGGDGATSASFGRGANSGGTGMSAGGGPKYVYRSFNNQAALDALVAITHVDYNFDKQAWWQWYRSQKKKPDTIDARRAAR